MAEVVLAVVVETVAGHHRAQTRSRSMMQMLL